MKIALVSVADIQNYGDMLFPFIARNELATRLPDSHFYFFTPTEGILCGEKFYKMDRENLLDVNPDVILAMGGDVLHKYDTTVWAPIYKGEPPRPSQAFFSWLDYPAKFKGWFSCGALRLACEEPCEISEAELASLNYIGVRDIQSKKNLEGRKLNWNDSRIQVVPDIGWYFGPYFLAKKATISNEINNFINEGPYGIVTFNSTSIGTKDIISLLQEIKMFIHQTGIRIVYFPLITASTYTLNDALFSEDDDGFIVFPKLDLHDMGALLVNSKFYVGSSLHGAVTVLSSGNPAAIIHRTPLDKFISTLGGIYMLDMFSREWKDIRMMLQKCVGFDSSRYAALNTYCKFIQISLNSTLNELAKDIRSSLT